MKKTVLPALGTPFGGGLFAGEYTLDGERFALVVAPKSEGEKLDAMYKEKSRGTFDGTDSDDDGLLNSMKIDDANHPAVHFCRSLRIAGHDDWYLPSRDELAQLWRNLGPRRQKTPELFKEGGAEAFATRWYWSSTESASYSYCAWYLNFHDGYQDYYDKSTNFGVRAVRRLKI